MTQEPVVYANGRFQAASRARIPLLDRGFLMGDGVFETLRTYGRVVLRPYPHFDRLGRSVQAIGLPGPIDLHRLASIVRRGVERVPEGEVSIRLWITRGAPAFEYGVPADATPRIYALFRPLPPTPAEVLERGISIVLIPDDRPAAQIGVKLLCTLPALLLRRDAHARGAYEAVRVRDDGRITEGTMSNVFAVVQGALVTPPISDGVLDGMTRELVFEAARELRLGVREESLQRVTLEGASEAFLTHTSAGVVPVVSIDGHRVADGKVGPIGRSLVGWFARLATRPEIVRELPDSVAELDENFKPIRRDQDA